MCGISRLIVVQRRLLHAAPLRDVTLVEVGPRDGLQNEPAFLPTPEKLRLIQQLTDTGLSVIEATSFVSPKAIPQMADAAQVMAGLQPLLGDPTDDSAVRYPVLVPNVQGLNAAIESKVQDIAIFAAASESFSRRNIRASIDESLSRYREVCTLAKQHALRVRGYVSCVIGCPYEGPISPSAVIKVASALLEMGCYEISLGDTIGVGTPGTFRHLLLKLTREVPVQQLAVHCHDTYGQALANILASLELGVKTVDASVGGLGGCPYAPGATGNVATEDVVYMLNGMGLQTGVDLDKLARVGDEISRVLGRPNASRAGKAMIASWERRKKESEQASSKLP